MIQAKATPMGDKLRLEIIHPDNQGVIIKMVESKPEGLRVVYFVNRDYMREKLLSWLRQRAHNGHAQVMIKARGLQVVLNYHKNCDFRSFCAVVHRHRADFETVAPSAKSQHYPFYTNQILPVLNDAAEMEGAR
jgi:hypothetical protein